MQPSSQIADLPHHKVHVIWGAINRCHGLEHLGHHAQVTCSAVGEPRDTNIDRVRARNRLTGRLALSAACSIYSPASNKQISQSNANRPL
jgi:hypothetical protein